MRILMVSEDVPHPNLGGLGKHALNLAKELARAGHQVDFLGNAHHCIEEFPEQRGPGQFFAELRGFERGWKQGPLGAFHPAAHRLNGGALLRPLLLRGKAYDVIHYHGHLPWVAASIPPDVAFVQTRHDQGGDCMVKTRFRAGQGICTERDPKVCAGCATSRPNALQRSLSSWSVKDMRRLTELAYERHATVFVSEFLRSNFEKVSRRPVQGRIIPNAVDASALDRAARGFQSLAPARSDGAALELFAAGALFDYKGFQELLEALARAASGAPAFRLRIAGTGPLEAELRRRFASDAIEFMGWVDYPTVLRSSLGADAILVPSVCEEPCATTVLEALALGKTVYALRSGGTPEMLPYAGSAGGSLILLDSMDQLAQAALAHRTGAGIGGVDVGQFKNDIGHMARAVEAVYESVIEAKNRRAEGAR